MIPPPLSHARPRPSCWLPIIDFYRGMAYAGTGRMTLEALPDGVSLVDSCKREVEARLLPMRGSRSVLLPVACRGPVFVPDRRRQGKRETIS